MPVRCNASEMCPPGPGASGNVALPEAETLNGHRPLKRAGLRFSVKARAASWKSSVR
jgi:hypothetical protein